MRYLIVSACVCGFSTVAAAQYPQPPAFPTTPYSPAPFGSVVNPNNFMPNIYDPRNQPLSPYLNLFRGNNPGVNYFYGVRPGTLPNPLNAGRAPTISSGAARQPFFPELTGAQPTLPNAQPSSGTVLPPAGHPTVYGNTMGYFPSAPGGVGGGARPGLAGAGAGRTPVPVKKN